MRHLQCFLAVAQQQSIQRAAASLSISQPAVSKTIKELEAILAVRLFQRSRKGTVLTRHAEIFLHHARASVTALRDGVENLGLATNRGSELVAIGVLPTVAPSLMPPALFAFRRQVPDGIVRVLTGSNVQLLNQLKSGELELVVGRLSDPDQMVGLSFEHLFAEPLMLVVRPGHPLLAEPAASIADISRFWAVLPVRGTVIRHTADSLMISHGQAPMTDYVETLSVSLGRTLTRDSDAVWFVPYGAVKSDVESGWLARLPVPTGGTEEPVGLTLRGEPRPTATVQVLIDAIRESAAARRASGTVLSSVIAGG